MFVFPLHCTNLPCSVSIAPKGNSIGNAGNNDETSTPSTSSSSKSANADNTFRQFRRLCAEIAEENSYTGKAKLIRTMMQKGSSGNGFNGDVYLWFKLLLPGAVKTVYNLKDKQLVKIFSMVS